MKSKEAAGYRLRLATGFLKEAEEDFELERWRSCVDNSQLAVENSGKAVIACFRPVEKTHAPNKQMIDLVEKKIIDPALERDLEKLIELSGELGFEEHLLTDYGDEAAHMDPWQLFDEKDAEQALNVARKSVEISKRIYKFYFEKAS